ncbi:hypothetical protein HPB50_023285 [Hyalomma asiaticum]|uniref:Uncharacterized protein n=1 Tax=Hyalomma asiaticum TaxID=266040 RepID=A0ACB7TPI0_HYAAI|nr:hypothetical protein HPB50_023285 [Hyalomma asiaticum]
MSSWLRYWVELRGNSLIFYSPKSLLAKERTDHRWSASGFPDSGAELLRTIEQLRVKVNKLTSSCWNLPPATLPVLYDIDAFLGIVAVQVTGSLDSRTESRTVI